MFWRPAPWVTGGGPPLENGKLVSPSPRRSKSERSRRDPISRLLLLGERRLRIARVKDYLRSSLWFLPAVALSAAALLALSTTKVDRSLHTAVTLPMGFVIDADSARGFLSLISSWMLTFIGLAFTMTIVVLQLASAQFSPRVLGTLLRDRYSQMSLGIFIGTFAYSFMVLREVRSGAGDEFVPAVSLVVAFTLVLISLGVFIRYVNHVAQSIRAGSVITTVATATRREFDIQWPRRENVLRPDGWRPYRTIPAPEGGLLRSFDQDGLVGLAKRWDIVIEIVPEVGGFVPLGAPLVRVLGGSSSLDEEDVLSQIRLGQERSMHQDPAFGFRQLVDIAERALSPGVNDPTTAVQVIDQLHDLLRDLLSREIPTGSHTDSDGNVRLVVPTPSWVDFLRLAVEEIRHYGAGSIQVSKRLRSMLLDLRTVAPDEYIAVVDHELSQLRPEASGELIKADQRTTSSTG